MSDPTPFHPHRDGTLIDILVQPRASKTEITGIHDGALRIRIAAPPVEGAANDAIIDFFSKRLNVRKSDLEITSGASARRKRLLVRDIAPATAHDLLTS